MRRGLTVLTYHRVLPTQECAGYPLASLVIPMEVFDGQMSWLAEHCRVLPVREAIRSRSEGDRSSRRPLAAVTFDDGYADGYERAAPVLRASGLRGTFFVTTSFVERGEPMWFDRAADAWSRLSSSDRGLMLERAAAASATPARNGHAVRGIEAWMERIKRAKPALRAELIEEAVARAGGEPRSKRYRPMSREQVARLHEEGHEIASHTMMHPILPQLDNENLRNELTESRRQLSEWTGADVSGFCYPNGNVDRRVEEAVRDAGYSYACTTAEGINRSGVNMTRLARLPITMHATVRNGHEYDELAFRCVVSRTRNLWRVRH